MALASVPAAPDAIDCAAISADETTLFQTDFASQGVAQPTQSFLRWAGGKRWLLHHLRTILGGFAINGYHEPFLGGGAVFFGSMIKGPIHLSDLNADLIETYVQVRDNHQQVADYLETHVNTSEHYYAVRASSPDDPANRAAKFIYLNHTSYNGIYRVNLRVSITFPSGIARMHRSQAVNSWPRCRGSYEVPSWSYVTSRRLASKSRKGTSLFSILLTLLLITIMDSSSTISGFFRLRIKRG